MNSHSTDRCAGSSPWSDLVLDGQLLQCVSPEVAHSAIRQAPRALVRSWGVSVPISYAARHRNRDAANGQRLSLWDGANPLPGGRSRFQPEHGQGGAGQRTSDSVPNSSMAIASMVSLIYSPSLVHRHERRDPPMRLWANERQMLA